MIFPIRDENPQLNTPYITYTLIALNILAWLLVQGAGAQPLLSQSICALGVIPADLTSQQLANVQQICPIDGNPDWLTLISSAFMHGSWVHLISNMWFLWIFGNNVEDSMGATRFAAFYLLCGAAASAAQVFSDTTSIVPMVGASGAIGGVMGAYIVLYPKVHVHMFIFFRTFAIPAVLMLGYWIITQSISAFLSIGVQGGGTAFWAHVGGFIAGMTLIFSFKNEQLLSRHPYRGWHQKQHETDAWKKVPTVRRAWY